MDQIKISFIGIGTYKSGTSWVTQCLREHPDVHIPQIKEIDFFSKNVNEQGEEVYSNYNKGLDWYLSQFNLMKDDSVNICGEFSNSYYSDEDSPERIKKSFPDVKLIICYRNPVDRAYSEYWWTKSNFSKDKGTNFNFNEFKDKNSLWIKRSFYSIYLRKYLNYFQRKNIHVIIYDDIKSNPEKVIKDLYEFLELEQIVPYSLNEVINPAAFSRYKSLESVFVIRKKLEKYNMGFVIDILKKLGIYAFLQNAYVKINREPRKYPKLSEADRKKMKNVFLEDIDELEKLINKDLSIWK